VPGLTGEMDPVTDSVYGTAPANAPVTVTIEEWGSFNVTATAQGNYLINLHGLVDLINISRGRVAVTTAEGYSVTTALSLSRSEICDYHNYYPNLIEIGSNRVDFSVNSYECDQPPYDVIRLLDAAGHLKAQQAWPSWQWYGNFSIYFYTNTQPVAIAPNDTVEVEWDNLPPVPTPVPTYAPTPFLPATSNPPIAVVVPTLTVEIDRVANIISGQALPNTTVALDLYRNQVRWHTMTTTVDAQGIYTANLGAGITLETGDTAQVTDTPNSLPAFSRVGVLPMVRVQLYQTSGDGFLPPLSVYTVSLQTVPPTPYAYQGAAANDGHFSFWLPPVKVGDSVSVTAAQQALHLSVPALTAHIERASGTVSGQAPPLARLRVESYDSSVSQYVTATASGTYSAPFPSSIYSQLTYFDAAGNQVVLPFATVHWEVEIDNPCIKGIVDMAGAPMTLTLWTNSGSLKSTLFFTTTYSSYSACFTTAVQSSDRLSLQSVAATEVFTVPQLTAQYNYVLSALEGAAPPQHELFAQLPLVGGGISTRRVFANGGGRYGVDTSDLNLLLLSRGRVYLYDEAGNSTAINFTVTGYPAFLPVVWR
jgi:hypothetical protein